MAGMRIDKYLWCVRIYKSRSLAADECRKGRVVVNGIKVKPSFGISISQQIEVSKPPVLFTYVVKEYPGTRVSAKLVERFLDNLTPDEEVNKLKLKTLSGFVSRQRGLGRPTKKERRSIDRLNDSLI